MKIGNSKNMPLTDGEIFNNLVYEFFSFAFTNYNEMPWIQTSSISADEERERERESLSVHANSGSGSCPQFIHRSWKFISYGSERQHEHTAHKAREIERKRHKCTPSRLPKIFFFSVLSNRLIAGKGSRTPRRTQLKLIRIKREPESVWCWV